MSALPCALKPSCVAGDVAKTAADTVLDTIADAIGKAVELATAGVGTSWVRVNTPLLASEDGRASSVVAFLGSEVAWVVAAIAVLSILIGAGRAAFNGSPEPLRELIKGLVTLTIVAGAGAAAIGLMVTASDAFAQGVIDDALKDGDFGKTVAAMLVPAGPGAPFAVITLGLIAFLVSLLQMALLVFRAGVLVLLTGLLPLAFSAAGTETGRAWSRRYTTWLLALILYKPAAALIYAASFKLVASAAFSANGILKATVGVSLMVAAVLALPGLMRVLAPAVTAVHLSGGSSGAATAAAVIPTGAKLAGGPATLAAMGASAMPTGAVNAPAPPTPSANGAGPNSTSAPDGNPAASAHTSNGTKGA